MGTRADFYIEQENKIQWIGSKAMDGYAVAEAKEKYISPHHKEVRSVTFLVYAIKTSKTKEDYLQFVKEYLTQAQDATFPEQGWPWPWDNSKMTDETYLFKDSRVWRMFKHDGDYDNALTPCLFSPVESVFYDEDGEPIEQSEKIEILVPDMKGIKNVTLGDRSGLIVLPSKAE